MRPVSSSTLHHVELSLKLISGVLFIFGLASLGYELSPDLSGEMVRWLTLVGLGCIVGMMLLGRYRYVQIIFFMLFVFLQGLLLPHYLILPVRSQVLTPAILAAIAIVSSAILLATWQQPDWIRHQGKLSLVALVLSLVGFFWLFPQQTQPAFAWGVLTAVVFGVLLFSKAANLFKDRENPPLYMTVAREVFLQALALFWVAIILQLMTDQIGS